MHLWEVRWVRDIAILVLIALTAKVAYAASAITAPILIGLGLAYVANPSISWAQRKWAFSRLKATAVIVSLVFILGLAALMFALPQFIYQADRLIQRLPMYLARLAEVLQFSNLAEQAKHLADDAGESGSAIDPSKIDDLSKVGGMVLGWLGVGAGILGSIIATTTYLIIFATVVTVCFVGFSWRFEEFVQWCKQLIPPRHQVRTCEVVAEMDRAVSAFMRGRMIQALIMAVILCPVWWRCGVPYWLLLAVITGALNFVPFASVAGCVLAILLMLADMFLGSGNQTMLALIVVPVWWAFAQKIDNTFVEPWIQSGATNLSPIAVIVVVLLGGKILGVLGLILAIPVTACLKILFERVIMPEFRHWLATRA